MAGTAPGDSGADTEVGQTDTSSGDVADALPLPSPFFGELTGDYYVPAGTLAEVVFEDPDTPTWNTIHGSLRIEAGAELRMNASLRVEGAVDCEAGSVVVSDPYGFTFEVEALSVVGESEDRASWTNVFLTAGRAEFEHAHVQSGRIRVEGGPSHLVDSTLDRVLVTMLGDGAETSRVEFNRFDGVQLYASATSIQFNEFLFQDGSNGTLVLSPNGNISWPNVVCEGEHALAQDFVFENNVLGPVGQYDPHVSIDRDYGPVDLSGNYFVDGLPSWDSIDDWEGADAACRGQGAFGGPATVQPTLDAPPAVYGPRR